MKLKRSSQQGIAMIEAMIATVILAIGLLGTIGLQARAYSAMNQAGARSEATIASEKLLGMMSTDLDNLPAYAMAEGGAAGAPLAPWLAETRVNIPNAVVAVAVTPSSNGTDSTAVTVTIKWQRKSDDPTNVSTVTSYLSKSS